MNLQRELRRALRRREAPAGFEQRVLRAIRQMPQAEAKGGGWWRLRSLVRLRLWVPALAAVAALVLVVGQVREQRRQRALAEDAGQKVVYALDLAASKLAYVQQKALEPRLIRTERLEKR